MKKTLILSLSLFALSGAGTVLANDHGQHMEKRLTHMTDKLSLSDTQAAAMRDILTEQHQAMQQVRAETHSKIQSILTPEQQTKFDTLRDERSERWSQRRPHREDCKQARGKRGERDGESRRWGKRNRDSGAE